jgi:drug/metabolite transporter (DMT)-like permease
LVIPYVLISTFQFQFAKDALNYASVFFLMGVRFLIAASLLFCVLREFHPIFNKDTTLLSLFTAASAGLWGFGLLYVSPSESAVLSYTMPLFSIPISLLVLSEKIRVREAIGTTVGVLGVIVYSLPFLSSAITLVGAILTLANAVFWALYTVYYRKLKTQNQGMTVATQFLVTSAIFLLLSPLKFKLVLSPSFWVDLTYLSVLSAVVSFLLWNTMARSHRVGKMASLIYLTPAAATLVQAIQTSIMPQLVSLVGISVMTLGVGLSTLDR